MIPSKCRLRNSCVEKFCWTRSQRRGASSRAVWSHLNAKDEVTAKPSVQGEPPTLPAPYSSMAEKGIVVLLWLPCPVLSPAFLLLISFLPSVSSIDSVSTCYLSQAASPKGTQQGKEWKGTQVLKSVYYLGKTDWNPYVIYRNCRWKLHHFAILSLKWELHLFTLVTRKQKLVFNFCYSGKKKIQVLVSDIFDLLKWDRITGNFKSKRPIQESACDFTEKLIISQPVHLLLRADRKIFLLLI